MSDTNAQEGKFNAEREESFDSEDGMSGPPETMPLEPCPFCGESDTSKIKLVESTHFYSVVCFGCGAKGPVFDDHPIDAVQEWNLLHPVVLRRMHHQYLQIESHLGYSEALMRQQKAECDDGDGGGVGNTTQAVCRPILGDEAPDE